MAYIWLYTLLSVFIVSIISLIGILTLAFRESGLKRILLFLVSFAAGALLGDALIHILPEVIEEYGFGLKVSLSILLGIVLFFILEKFIHWRHCHAPVGKSHPHPLAFMNIIGDGIHNFIDGMLIAGSYLASFPLGITTTIAVILHEIPQEFGDFGVLLHAGMTKAKALFFNLLSATAAILGAVLTLIIGSSFTNLTEFILPITAGGFIYIAGTDLIPELHKKCEPASENVYQLIAFILGIGAMVLLLLFEF
ncbi:MAG TPA: ZIP family metal transporter [Candidatus Nanoarchaeia archaeon]|nr:ZIP family metal transporter [Candidatus Nanoarchaeia archaeon]